MPQRNTKEIMPEPSIPFEQQLPVMSKPLKIAVKKVPGEKVKSKWMQHVSEYRKANEGTLYKDCLKEAKKTYVK